MTDRRPLVIWGATGQARVLRELTGHFGYAVTGLFDNNPDVPSPFAGVPIYYGTAGFAEWRRTTDVAGVSALVAIGGARGSDRLELQRWLEREGLTIITAIHPTAVVTTEAASIGHGSQILARASVMVDTTIGESCILNTAASIDHECTVGDGVHVCPGATIAGCVRIGDFTMIGSGAVVLPRVRIGANVVVGAGAVVTRDLPDNVVAFGSPARVVRPNPEIAG